MDTDEMFKEIDFVAQNKKISSLMLMITYNCSMYCPYCKVIQGNRTMAKDVYKKAVEYLLSSESNEVTLRFFGGEPLIYEDLLLEIINYAESLKKLVPEKKIKYLITTNGLHLSEDLLQKLSRFEVCIMLSIDGDMDTLNKERPIKSGNLSYEDIFNGLDLIKNYNLSYFVNMLVTPYNTNNLLRNFIYLVDKGAKNIQICYESGVLWSQENVVNFLNEFSKLKEYLQDSEINLLNLKNQAEPVMLSDEIIVDVDGKLYFDIAIFHEKTFPALRESMFLGDVFKGKNIQDIFHEKKDIFLKLIGSYPDKDERKELILNNIYFGLVMNDFIKNYMNFINKKTESRIFSNFLIGTVKEQEELTKKYTLDFNCYFLQVHNKCINNCIFCKNKSLERTTKEMVEFKLKSNLDIRKKRLCLVGNEPLNHSLVMEILDLCNEYGFSDVQVMSSGMFIKELDFLRKLKSRGVNSFSLPIYSKNAKVHDMIVQRKGDFEDLMKGIRNLKFLDMEIYLHTNLLKQNIDNLEKLENFVSTEITSNFCILPIRCKHSNLHYGELIPSYNEMIKKLRVSSLVGFPVCIVEKIQNSKFLSSDKISDSIKLYLLDQNYLKLKKCRNCCYFKKCLGVFKEYLDLYGSGDIKPCGKNESSERNR